MLPVKRRRKMEEIMAMQGMGNTNDELQAASASGCCVVVRAAGSNLLF
jgi:hypothetical protein